MAANQYYISGTANWARLREDNMDEYGGKQFYSMVLELDEASEILLKESGSRLKVARNEANKYQVKLRRNHVNEAIPEFGGPPEVIDNTGAPFSGLIGNGSKVTAKIVVYDTKMGKGTRLEKVRVDDLVVYEGKNDAPKTYGDNLGIPF